MAARDAAREWGPPEQVRKTLQVDVQDKLAQSDASFSATWRLIPEPAPEPTLDCLTPLDQSPSGSRSPSPSEAAAAPAPEPEPELEPQPRAGSPGARSPSPEQRDATQWFASTAGPQSWARAGGRKPGSAGRLRPSKASKQGQGSHTPSGDLADVITTAGIPTAYTGKFSRPQTPVRTQPLFGTFELLLGSVWHFHALCLAPLRALFGSFWTHVSVKSGAVGCCNRAQQPEATAAAAARAGGAAR